MGVGASGSEWERWRSRGKAVHGGATAWLRGRSAVHNASRGGRRAHLTSPTPTTYQDLPSECSTTAPTPCSCTPCYQYSLAQANALKRAHVPYDPAPDETKLSVFKSVCSGIVWGGMWARGATGSREAGAVFIVGQPRSGSTLVEVRRQAMEQGQQ